MNREDKRNNDLISNGFDNGTLSDCIVEYFFFSIHCSQAYQGLSRSTRKTMLHNKKSQWMFQTDSYGRKGICQ